MQSILAMSVALLMCSQVLAYPDYIPGDVIQLIESLHTICFPKLGVTMEEVTSYQPTNKDPKMMCYMQCMMLEAKWMTPDGEIKYDYILQNSHPEIKHLLEAGFNKCKDIDAGIQDCEKSYNFQLCLSKADPEHWFLP